MEFDEAAVLRAARSGALDEFQVMLADKRALVLRAAAEGSACRRIYVWVKYCNRFTSL